MQSPKEKKTKRQPMFERMLHIKLTLVQDETI